MSGLNSLGRDDGDCLPFVQGKREAKASLFLDYR